MVIEFTFLNPGKLDKLKLFLIRKIWWLNLKNIFPAPIPNFQIIQ